MKFRTVFNLIFIFLFAAGSLVGCQSSEDKDGENEGGQSQEQNEKGQQPQQPQQGGEQQGQQPLRQQQPQGDVDVSDKEIEQFSDIYEDIRSKREETRPKMEQAIKDEGLTMQRFQTIMRDQQQSRMQQQGQSGQGGESDLDISDEEMEKFENAQKEVQKIQQEMQQKMMKTIEESELDQQRFQEISRAIQSNPELRKKLQEESGGGQQQPQQPQGR